MEKPDRHAEIAKRAYTIWKREGCPKGCDLEHWLRAEAEIDPPKPVKPRHSRADRAPRPD